MASTINALSTWRILKGSSLGRWLFARVICLQAPYFATIRPRIDRLEPGLCEARLRKRRAVLNHVGSVHAIALCNLAELAAGLATDVSIPLTHRWIPKGMTVEYLKKATTSVRAIGSYPAVDVGIEPRDVIVPVEVSQEGGEVVFRARVTMWVCPRPERREVSRPGD